ncbi:hypothetical protein BDV93DRAFT_562368 [Ceratobasidium sp. AG-I]|nr:hypothetical protein BDV93DRAFT_562368 [Ceratobasidium sp. AG-I]
MSAPSAGSQAIRARERAADELKVRFESLEARYNSETKALTSRVRHLEGELQDQHALNATLRDSVDDFRARIMNLENSRATMDRSLQVVDAKLAVEESRIDVATADLEVVAPGLANYSEGDEGSNGENSTHPANLEAEVQARASTAAQLSKAAMDSEAVKDAVGKVLYNLYRVANFKNIADKHYPHVPIDHGEWPHTSKPDGSRENHVRFNFEEPFDSATNLVLFNRWVDAVRMIGPVQVVAAKAHLEVIDEEDLRSRVKMRYDWERRSYLKAMKNKIIPTKNRGPDQETTEQAGEDSAAGASAPGATNGTVEVVLTLEQLAVMPTANRQSHQRTKIDERARKRPGLSGEDAKYKAPKYDTVLTIGATSEDDYEVQSVNGHPPQKTGRIVSREWWYASKELLDCKKAIDAVPDTKPQTKRAVTVAVRGDVRPGSPRRNKTLENRVRQWMVDPEVLNQHPQWMQDGRVLADDATDVPATRSKRKVSSVQSGSVAGPSNKGKQARLTLQARKKILDDKVGESIHEPEN